MLELRNVCAGYWRVILQNGPLNLLSYALSDALSDAVAQLEQDQQTRVVVFESGVEGYFMAHFDLTDPPPDQPRLGPRGLPDWIELGQRLHHASFVSIGLVRGRARGAGSELLQMLDLRFASRELAVLGQPEVGCGVIPGGGGLERLPQLVGRARALEIILGSQDFDAETAERYGWINRSLPDDQLDPFVDRLARRIAAFSPQALVLAKQIVNERSAVVDPADQSSTQQRFFGLLESAADRVGRLMARGLQQPGDLEEHLGDRLGEST
jgi:enoyl-CoA hydratase/carnithine racemase